VYNNIKKLINTDNLKKIYVKFIKLPIYYKVLVSIILSLILHFSFTTLLYIGMYNYTVLYQIPFSAIEDFNLNLCLMPFYFDTIIVLFQMFYIFISAYILTLAFQIYFKGKNSFHLKKIMVRMYKNLINDSFIKFRNRSDKKNIISGIFILIVFLLMSTFLFLLNLHVIYYTIITILISIFSGYYFAYAKNRLTFKLLFPLLILFIIIQTFFIISSNQIGHYLASTKLGGKLPLSLKIKDKYFDGFLLLRTKERIYMYDVNKTFISEFKADSIDKVTYKYSIDNDESTDKNMTDISMDATMSDTEINFTSYHK